MKHKIPILIFALFLMLLFGSVEQVLACSCREKASVCEAFGGSKAVFVGKVLEGESPERMSDMIGRDSNDNSFKFKVINAFAGVEQNETISIHTGLGFGDCGFPFQKGETYLVYAHEYKGQLRTSICSRSSHISRKDFNKEDFEFLRSLSKKEEGATVEGKAEIYAKSSFEEDSVQPFSNLKLKLERTDLEQKPIEILTDKLGQYKLSYLPTGSYKITPILPKYYEVDDYETDEFWLNNKGCTTQDFSVEMHSLVHVKIIDPDVEPVKSIWVEFVPENTNYSIEKFGLSPREFGVTNPQGGLYNFNIPPGRYTISINYFNSPNKEHPFPTTFYPNVTERSNAKIIDVKLGSEIENLTIQIPFRLTERMISGQVFWDNGEIETNARILLLDANNPNFCINGCDDKVDSQGKFIVSSFEGRTYRIVARVEKENGEITEFYEGEAKLVISNKDISDIKIIISSKKANR